MGWLGWISVGLGIWTRKWETSSARGLISLSRLNPSNGKRKIFAGKGYTVSHSWADHYCRSLKIINYIIHLYRQENIFLNPFPPLLRWRCDQAVDHPQTTIRLQQGRSGDWVLMECWRHNSHRIWVLHYWDFVWSEILKPLVWWSEEWRLWWSRNRLSEWWFERFSSCDKQPAREPGSLAIILFILIGGDQTKDEENSPINNFDISQCYMVIPSRANIKYLAQKR